MDGRQLPNSRESNGSAWRTRPHQYELLHPWGLRSGYFRRPATCVGDSHAHGAAVSHLAITEGSLRSRLVAYSRTDAWDGTRVRAPFRVKLRHYRTAVRMLSVFTVLYDNLSPTQRKLIAEARLPCITFPTRSQSLLIV